MTAGFQGRPQSRGAPAGSSGRRMEGAGAGIEQRHQRPRFTLAADFLGRTLLDADKLVLEETTYQFTQRLDSTLRSATRTTLGSETDNLGLYLASVGLKINPFGRLLLAGSVLIAIGDGGLQDQVTPVFGLDYSF